MFPQIQPARIRNGKPACRSAFGNLPDQEPEWRSHLQSARSSPPPLPSPVKAPEALLLLGSNLSVHLSVPDSEPAAFLYRLKAGSEP